MFFRWVQPPPEMRPFFDMSLNNLVNNLSSQAGFIMTGAASIKPVAPMVAVLDDGGYILLLAFGVVGALTYLNKRNRTGLMVILVSLTAFLTLLPQMFDVFSIDTLIPDRWFNFTYIVLSIVAMAGLFRLVSIIPANIIKICVLLLIVSMSMFMMTTASRSNADSPMVFNGANRVGYTQSELDVISTLSDIGSGRPITDGYYGFTFPYVIGFDRYENFFQGDSRVFIQRNYYLHHTEWDRYYIDRVITGRQEEAGDVREMISDYMRIWGIDDWPIIYRNNTVTVYSNAAMLAQN
jgi:uncharacterized membrane protein